LLASSGIIRPKKVSIGRWTYHNHVTNIFVARSNMEATPELLECVYSFLVKNGHEAVAKCLAEEAKLDKKKLKKAVTKDLSEIFAASLK
jgi:hypothetical protein